MKLKSFKFQYGATNIKLINTLHDFQLYLNSNMELLILPVNDKSYFVSLLFKFQYGATNIGILYILSRNLCKFKFQYGATNIK